MADEEYYLITYGYSFANNFHETKVIKIPPVIWHLENPGCYLHFWEKMSLDHRNKYLELKQKIENENVLTKEKREKKKKENKEKKEKKEKNKEKKEKNKEKKEKKKEKKEKKKIEKRI